MRMVDCVALSSAALAGPPLRASPGHGPWQPIHPAGLWRSTAGDSAARPQQGTWPTLLLHGVQAAVHHGGHACQVVIPAKGSQVQRLVLRGGRVCRSGLGGVAGAGGSVELARQMVQQEGSQRKAIDGSGQFVQRNASHCRQGWPISAVWPQWHGDFQGAACDGGAGQ